MMRHLVVARVVLWGWVLGLGVGGYKGHFTENAGSIPHGETSIGRYWVVAKALLMQNPDHAHELMVRARFCRNLLFLSFPTEEEV